MSFRLIQSASRFGRARIQVLTPASSAIRATAKRWMSSEFEDKQIVDKPSPFKLPDRQCILCKHKIQVDYKNPRLISQFVSPLNGRLYDKHITGLCEKQQTILKVEHRKSVIAMYMPMFHKNPKYNKDFTLVNPNRPQRPNPY